MAKQGNMTCKIGSDGGLFLLKDGVSIEQVCPYAPSLTCGRRCPLFDEEGEKSVKLYCSPRELVYKIVSTLYAKEEAVGKIAKELDLFKLDFALEMVIPQYPIHKGAAKFYKEKGVWRDGLTISK